MDWHRAKSDSLLLAVGDVGSDDPIGLDHEPLGAVAGTVKEH